MGTPGEHRSDKAVQQRICRSVDFHYADRAQPAGQVRQRHCLTRLSAPRNLCQGRDLKVSFKVVLKIMADGVVEIITGRERRRRWSLEDKLRIVAETLAAGGSVKQEAARHDLYPGLLFTWRRQVRSGKLALARGGAQGGGGSITSDLPTAAPDSPPDHAAREDCRRTSRATTAWRRETVIR